MRTVLCLARDKGPSTSFRAYQALFPKDPVTLLVGDGEAPIDEDDILNAVSETEIALVGMSSKDTSAEELRAIYLMQEFQKPVVLFADTFGAWHREHFAEVRKLVAGVVVMSSPEIEPARRFFGPDVRVFATANPAWDAFLKPGTRKASLALLGLPADQCIILISGTKKRYVNTAMLRPTMQVAERLREHRPEMHFVYAPHPGEEHLDRAFYESFVKESWPNARFSVLAAGVKADDVVPAIAGLIHPGTSSLAIHNVMRFGRLARTIDCPFAGVDEYVKAEVGGWAYTLNAIDASYRPSGIHDYFQTIDTIARGDDSIACRPPEDLVHLKPGVAGKRLHEALKQV